MKKLLAMLCMITCIFGLTACGGEEEIAASMQNKAQVAEIFAKDILVREYAGFMTEGEVETYIGTYTPDELAYIFEGLFSEIVHELGISEISFDGQGIIGSINSFASAYDTMGTVVEFGDPETTVKDDEIIVNIPVVGEKKNGNAEVIFSTKRFLRVESAGLNADLSMGEMMEKAGLNTLLGMGTVFTVLVLIMAIIYAFGIIPKMQKKAADKKAAKANNAQAEESVPAAAPVAAPVPQDLTDDLELVAVIAAAIAASEGAASTDGFVVRSIRKANRR